MSDEESRELLLFCVKKLRTKHETYAIFRVILNPWTFGFERNKNTPQVLTTYEPANSNWSVGSVGSFSFLSEVGTKLGYEIFWQGSTE